MNYTEMKNEKDMMDGNINRMFVTDNLEELIEIYTCAKERLDVLLKENMKRIINCEGKMEGF